MVCEAQAQALGGLIVSIFFLSPLLMPMRITCLVMVWSRTTCSPIASIS